MVWVTPSQLDLPWLTTCTHIWVEQTVGKPSNYLRECGSGKRKQNGATAARGLTLSGKKWSVFLNRLEQWPNLIGCEDLQTAFLRISTDVHTPLAYVNASLLLKLSALFHWGVQNRFWISRYFCPFGVPHQDIQRSKTFLWKSHLMSQFVLQTIGRIRLQSFSQSNVTTL